MDEAVVVGAIFAFVADADADADAAAAAVGGDVQLVAG